MLIRKVYQGEIPQNKIMGVRTTSDTDTYSCTYINNLIKASKNTSNNYTYGCAYINNKVDGTVLFNNSSSTSSSFVLSDTYTNYRYLDIIYSCNTYGTKVMRMYTTSNYAIIDYYTTANTNINQLGSARLTFSGTSVTFDRKCLVNFKVSDNTVNAVEQGNDLAKVSSVIGYK